MNYLTLRRGLILGIMLLVLLQSSIPAFSCRKEKSMSGDSPIFSDTDDPNALYKEACRLARSSTPGDLANLQAWITNDPFLNKIDTEEDYHGDPMRLRIAGILQILAENSAPAAAEVLLALTKSKIFLSHPARIELLIQALVEVRPSPQEAVAFWEKYCQPNDGFSSVTVGALLENGSPPAVALFEKKIQESGFRADERRSWLKSNVLIHRNDLPLLQACQRLFQSSLEDQFRLLLIDVLADYKPDEWYGPGYWYKPPPREEASKEAKTQLLSLLKEVSKHQPMPDAQREQVRRTIRELEKMLGHSQ